MYVGKTTGLYRRWRTHINNSTSKKSKLYEENLYQDIRNLGVDKFTFHILAICKEEDLELIERTYINKYLLDNISYNKRLLKSNGINRTILDIDEIKEIYNYLLDYDKTMKEIGKIYGISSHEVEDLNNGVEIRLDNVVYPLRRNNIYRKRKQEMNKEPKKVREDKNKLCKEIGCKSHVTKNSLLCKECFKKEQAKNILPKEQLVDMLNRFTFRDVGEYCNVSDNAIKKWCVKYGISKYAKDYDTPIKREVFINKMKNINNK